MDFGEQTTGTRDEHYNLVSVLYHALHGAENCERYVLDAEAVGDERLAAFFRETQAAQTEMAERAKELLGIGGDVVEGGVAPEAGGGTVPGAAPLETDEISSDAEPHDVRGRAAPEVGFPAEGGVSPDPAPGDVPPTSADIQREPDVRAGEVDMPVEEAPPMPDPPTPSGTTPRPDEDLVAESRGVAPEDTQREASSEHPTKEPSREAPPGELREEAETDSAPGDSASEAPPTRETPPGEPGRATQEQGATRPTEGEQNQEKGLLDKVKDALTGQEESDRQRDQ